MLSALRDFLLGDPAAAARPQGPVQSFEDLHNSAQAILIPQALPKGISVNAVVPLSPTLALTHRVHLETGKPKSGGDMGQFAGLAGLGGAPKEERAHRHYVGGFVASNVSDSVREGWG